MIPIHNLYYLLCYAWNRLPTPAETQQVRAEAFERPLGLLTQMLLTATQKYLRRGLPLAYAEQTEELPGLRGRVLLVPTLERGLLRRGRAVCTYDELSAATPFTNLLLGTLRQLGRARTLPRAVRRATQRMAGRFPSVVQPVVPSVATLRAVRRLRLGEQERFLFHLCELLYQCALPVPDAAAGRWRFRDFRRDEALMARIFEQFVRNFYRLEQRRYRVRSETIAWKAATEHSTSLALLPTMITDTSLEAPDRKIILDTKYYAAALRTHYDRQRLIAPHLYQLYAYLQNQRAAPQQPVEGILLYPAATQEIALEYTLGRHSVRIVTLNLQQPWPGIAADLLALVEYLPKPP